MKRHKDKPPVQSSFEGIGASNYYTPGYLYERLNSEYGPFTLDAAAAQDNSKCDLFYDEGTDGRLQPWTGRVWCNPPFTKILTWVKKAHESTLSGECELVCMCLPAHTSTEWFHDYALPFAEIKWIRRKVRFGGAKRQAIMPTVILIFRSK